MLITIDTKYPLSSQDLAVLEALVMYPTAKRPTEATQDAPRAESAPEPSEAAGDTSSALDEALLEQAISRGTALVKSKKGAVVRAALEKIGAKKVTDITTNEDLQAFLAELP